MLILKRIQKLIWGNNVFGGNQFREPENEFWQNAISEVKEKDPDFIFIAEVYWGVETELLSLGFDYCYDKVLYDVLRSEDIPKIKERLLNSSGLGNRGLVFLENHDEARAAEVFEKEKSRAAAVIMALYPGAKMYHQGQLEGYTVHLPIQLLRKSEEYANQRMYAFYKKYFSALTLADTNSSEWIVAEVFPAGEENTSNRNFVASRKDNKYLAAVNYSNVRSQCFIKFPEKFDAEKLLFRDLLNDEVYERDAMEISERGIFLDLEPYGYHIFHIGQR
jgi:hypothetical protein